jgi:hypothetical protein
VNFRDFIVFHAWKMIQFFIVVPRYIPFDIAIWLGADTLGKQMTRKQGNASYNYNPDRFVHTIVRLCGASSMPRLRSKQTSLIKIRQVRGNVLIS